MKKTVIPVSFDAEKLSAAKLYMAQKDLSFEEEMEKAADALYSKHVPAGVREFIELNAGNKFSSTTIIAPITSVPKKRAQPTHVFIDCDFLESESVILLEQLRTIDKKRLSDRLGQLSQKDMYQVESAMSVSLGMEQSQPEVRHEW